MAYPEFHYRWQWRLKADPKAFWPFIADTNRFNRETDVPPVEHLPEDGKPATNGRQRLRLFRFGVRIEWEEEPFEWVRPYRFGVVRRYKSGPVATLRVLAELTPLKGGGSRLLYQVWARPSMAFGLVAIPAQIGVLGRRPIDEAVRRYDRLAVRQQLPLDLPAHVRFASGGRQRLANLREKLLSQGESPALVEHLVSTIEKADDLAVSRLRPYVLADHWGAPRKDALKLFLVATRAGLLSMRWDLLCPLCRGAKEVSPTLGGVNPQVHCDHCKIDFTVNFERSVEVTFRPNEAVREVNVGEYCVGGPQVTPHIALQQLLPPGTKRTVTLPLEPGSYRLRTMLMPGTLPVSVVAKGEVSEATLRASSEGWPDKEMALSTKTTLHLDNATGSQQLFILERTAWSDQAATAAEVTALQLFRDLFANEVLRSGEQISVGSLAILFTDLRGSTHLYREIGDAPAFGLVLDHFSVLREAIEAEDGSIVKNIGDAIMAVFTRPVNALRAAFQAQQRLASPPAGQIPLYLKSGIHYGPCLAVTLNDRLDYFGSTVNMAARLQDLSSGEDVIITLAVRDDPEVADLLADGSAGLTTEPLETTLKGFATERFALWRAKQGMHTEQ
ncbi:MAG TPA: DUF5939 domain-containing protein [Chloroflexia bacterium]|nr:DUF5939 domain-containing protein [Chloroflexia bacterium]